jgi:pyochelin biosynthesis protein PchC
MRGDWFPFRVRSAAPEWRLVCMPPAGKGCSVFRTWQAAAPDDVEVLAVQLPGRETRLQEPPISDVGELADGIAAALVPFLGEPLVLFGHCYGAIVAFEVAQRLPEDFVALLSVSSCKAPHLLAPTGWSSGELSEVEILRDAYGKAVADLPAELLQALLPGLLADLVALDRYRCDRPVKLPCPIHLFQWTQDPTVSPAEVRAWDEYTAARFTDTLLDAHREALAPQGPAIASAITAELSRGGQ